MGAPLLLCGLFEPAIDAKTRHGAAKIVKRVLITAYFAVAGVMAVFSVWAASAAHTLPDPGADAVIVLGAGIRGDTVSRTLQNRLDTAARYYEENPGALVVVSGGRGQGKDVSEAYAMQKYLLEHTNVPAESIIREERSASTAENFAFSKALLNNLLGTDYRIVYVTNDFHILRAGIIARGENMDAQGLAAPTPLYIIPNSYMRESLALLYTLAFGA
jgi:uncharacterized SAM-binding protein YcdF (DUF218 family)